MSANFEIISQILASRVLNSVAEGFVIAALGWAMIRLFGPRNSGTRFVIWFWTLLGIAALPFVPRLNSSTLGSSALGSSMSAGAPLHAGFTISNTVAFYLFLFWAIVVAVLLGRIAVSMRHVWKLRRDSEEVDWAALDGSCVELLSQFDSRKRIKLCVSDNVRVPAALGFFRPAIVIPRWALQELSTEELKTILLHEMAHLQRRDDWTNFAQKVVKAIFFFHPAVWWIESRLVLEREMACDEVVVAHTANARAYAASLVSVAEKVLKKKNHGKVLTLAQAVLGRVRQTSLRIAQLLRTDRPSGTRVWRPAVVMLATISVAIFFAMPYAPDLVAIEDHSQPSKVADAASLPVSGAVSLPAASNAPKRILAEFKMSTPSLAIPAKLVTDRSARQTTPLRNPLQRASAERDPSLAPQMVFFVQAASFDAGRAEWHVRVWRLTVRDINGEEVQTTIVMNSI